VHWERQRTQATGPLRPKQNSRVSLACNQTTQNMTAQIMMERNFRAALKDGNCE
jgi:hypothetical protein